MEKQCNPEKLHLKWKQKFIHILTCERLVLNCMQRMSGIATLTKKYVDKLKGLSYKITRHKKNNTKFQVA